MNLAVALRSVFSNSNNVVSVKIIDKEVDMRELLESCGYFITKARFFFLFKNSNKSENLNAFYESRFPLGLEANTSIKTNLRIGNSQAFQGH